MHDPVQRMREFVRQQKQRAFSDRARIEWCRRIPALLPDVEAVMEVFRDGLGSDEPAAAVFADTQRPEYPLVIAFGRRGQRCDEVVPASSASPSEVGATCIFRCDLDGIVHGYRYPFHGVHQDVRAERFIDLGEPAAVDTEQLGHAVADFLEWAAVGLGRGYRSLSFWSAEPATAGVAPRVELRVVAA
jgi:hypothetical protein